MDTRLKLAYFSPVNPVQSGISDYSEELLPYLARYADIDLYVDDYTPTNQEITRQFEVYPAGKFSRQAGRYDTYLFHMGNSAAHSYIYRALQASRPYRKGLPWEQVVAIMTPMAGPALCPAVFEALLARAPRVSVSTSGGAPEPVEDLGATAGVLDA